MIRCAFFGHEWVVADHDPRPHPGYRANGRRKLRKALLVCERCGEYSDPGLGRSGTASGEGDLVVVGQVQARPERPETSRDANNVDRHWRRWKARYLIQQRED